ncbi:MAG TPA: hypothetical protein VES42_00855 [Pilimelia sp.]|nr:hypothetical protein [Pilimelia sp.]
MSVFERRPALRWLVPAVATAAVIAGGAAVGTLAAAAEPRLPPRTAAQLLVDLQSAQLDGLSGTVVQRAELGLPEVAETIGKFGGGLASLVSGSNTVKVWYAGPDKARVALLSTLGETDIIRNGRDVWLWESRGNTAKHTRLPVDGAGRPDHGPLPSATPTGLPASPQEAADFALRALSPTTEVTTGNNASVAGRDAYQLKLAPRDKQSLVGEVRLAIDAVEHVPLGVEIFAKGADEPAFEVTFSQVSFARPDAERFRFNPPPGVNLTEAKPDGAAGAKGRADHDAGDAPRMATVGTGWTSVLVARMSEAAGATGPGATGPGATGSGSAGAKPGAKSGSADAAGPAAALGLLGELPRVNGAWGSGRMLSGTLFSALLTDDGRLLIGAVTPARLTEAAASPQARLN